MTLAFSLVITTASGKKDALKLSHILLSQRLAACINIVPSIQSQYWWKGKIETASEYLLLIKTRKALYLQLEKTILKHHPYSTPEIIALAIPKGSRKYLTWLKSETAGTHRKSLK